MFGRYPTVHTAHDAIDESATAQKVACQTLMRAVQTDPAAPKDSVLVCGALDHQPLVRNEMLAGGTSETLLLRGAWDIFYCGIG